MAAKTPIRGDYNGADLVGFAEFQASEFVDIADGGTGATNATDARIALGLEIGTDVQSYHVNLDDISGLAVTDGGIIVGDGNNFVLETGNVARLSLGLGTTDSPTFNNLIVDGNLTVNGTQTILNTETLTVDDNTIVLNNNVTGAPTEDAGIEIERGSDTNVSLLWDETNNRWTIGTYDFVAANFIGNVTGQVSDISNFDTDDLTEGSTNQYYTEERVDDRVAALLVDSTTSGIDISYDDASNSLTISTDLSEIIESLQDNVEGLFVGGTGVSATYNDASNQLELAIDFSEFDTGSITEGSNLFFTDERVDDRISALLVDANTEGIDVSYDDAGNQLTLSVDLTEIVESLQDNVQGLFSGGTGITATYDDAANTLALSIDFTEFDTDDLVEGTTNLFYTEGRFDTSFAGKSTTDLTEGTNLYYTDTRANSAIDTRVDKAFIDALNVDADTLDGIDSTGFATSAQGTLADSALQSGDNITELTNNANYIDLTDISVTDSGGDGSLSYDNTTGVITYTGPSQAEVLAHISGGTGITVSGAGVIATTITQYADSDVEAYLSGGTGVSFSSGVISIGQAVGTTDNVTFNDVTVNGVLNSNDITAANISIDGNATITGDLTVEGTTTQVDSTTVTVADPLFKYAKDNTGNSVDIGFYGKYVQSSTTKYAGLAWDASQSDKFRLFHGLQTEPTTTVDITATGHTVGTLIANLEGDVTGNADTATALASGQNFSLTGDVTATAISFDGTGAVALSTTVTESAVTQHEAALTITESQISDLQSYLTAETNDLTSAVTWANVPDANITQSSVTQHQAALSITESQISDLQSYLTAETNDLSSVVTWANVPDANITESSVTQHEAALSITESQISDLGSYITAISTNTLTNKTINFEDNTAIVEYAVTVSGGNFLIDGEANATISFNPGIVYRFDLSDSSTASHPFALSETEDGTHNSGSEYTTGKTSNGTQGSAGAYVEYTVNAATPDILYYYCSSHSGMGGTVTVFGSSYGDSDVQAYLSAGAGISISGSGQISSTITQYTDSDARGAISVTDSGGDGSLSYDSGTGVITYTGPNQAEVLAHISGGTGITISGSGVIDTTITQYANSDVEAYLSGGTGVTFSSGVISIGQAVSTTSDVTFNDVTVSGDLIVSGTTTTINTETIELADNIIVFNSNATGSASQDAGIEIERGDDSNKTLIWNETDDKWTVGSETFVAGTFEGALTGDVTGNVTGDVIGDVTGAIIVTGKNESGSTIGAGVPVYISGQASSGTEFTVDVADADGTGTMPAIGITTASANNNAEVSILTFGKFVGLDTSSFSVGDELYVSTSGTLTTTAPTGESALIQKIAKVIRSHASDGEIFVQGAGRSNAVPNLDDGDIFIGNASNQAVTSSFNTLADARIALTNLEDLANVGFSAPGASEDDKVIFWDNTAGAFGLSTVSGLAGQGEVNTASNIGTAGVGIFDGKVGEDLQFKKLNAGSTKITITDDTSNNEVDIDFGSVAINDLSDVTITSVASNELLAWNGSAFVNIDTPDLAGLTLTSTDAGSSAAPTIELYRNSASPANADYLGELKFFGETSTGAKELYASITAKASDVTNGATDGTIEFMTVANGSNNIVARLNENGMLLTEGMTLKFEGATNDSFETNFTVTDPTADRTVTLPDATGTVILSSSSIGDLSDVDITTSAPTDGQALVWNASNSEFEPGTVASSTNYFQTIAVSGQSDIVPDSTTDTLNFAAGANITLTTDASTDTVTIAATGGAANAFSTLAVSGQSNVVADSETDTLTFVEGAGMTITTDASTDTITFASTGGSAGSMPVTLSGGTSDPINLSSISTIGAIPFTGFDGSTDNIDLTGTSQTVTTFADNDGDTKLEVERSADNDTVFIKAGGTDVLTATSSGVTISNLIVTGTSTQANEMKITDTVIELNADASSLGVDAGIVIERGSTGADAAFIWDESSDSFAVGLVSADSFVSFTKASGTPQDLPVSSNEIVFNHADGTADNIALTSGNLAFEDASGTSDPIASQAYGPETDMNIKMTDATLKAKTQTTGDNSTAVATTAFVQASLGGVESDTIKDTDNDTKIEVEATSDADEIVITTGGQERAKVDNNISMSARGGFFTHNLAMHASETFTIASTEGTVAAGPLDIQGTVDVQGSLVVL